MSKLPTLPQLVSEYRRLEDDCGFSAEEALCSVAGDLLWMCRQYRDAAKKWKKDCERLKAKYEPLMAEVSELRRKG